MVSRSCSLSRCGSQGCNVLGFREEKRTSQHMRPLSGLQCFFPSVWEHNFRCNWAFQETNQAYASRVEPLGSKSFEKLAVLQVSQKCRSLLQIPSFTSLFDLGQWALKVAQWKRTHLPNKMQFWSLGWEDPLEKGMATHSDFCLGNLMHRGSWRAIVYAVATSLTQPSN